MIKKSDKIFVAGHKGLIGSAIVRKLKLKGYKNILTIDKKKLNLIDQNKVFNFLKRSKPKFIFIAAAKVGGIYSNNSYKADFIYQNLAIQNNIIHGAFKAGIIPTKKARELYRSIADKIFLQGMQYAEPSVPKWKIKSAYYAVRLFGRWAINSSAPRGAKPTK